MLPAEVRKPDKIGPGQVFGVERLGRGVHRFVRRTKPPNEGLVDWLLSCPEKGFFTPIVSDSTDTLSVTLCLQETRKHA